jgi:hypothetical protein
MTTYIATEDIFVARGVRAFSQGDVVPASVVENLDIKDKVASDRTKAAASAKDAAVAKVTAPPVP